MSEHFLKRNPDNEPVCACGFRPEILDAMAPVGKIWKAKTAVLDHVKAQTESTTGFVLFSLPGNAAQRSPEAPFHGRHAVKYPRAGVRQTEDGRWLVTLWDGDSIVHVIDEDDRTHAHRENAFAQGWLTIGACRKSGTDLNGMANA